MIATKPWPLVFACTLTMLLGAPEPELTREQSFRHQCALRFARRPALNMVKPLPDEHLVLRLEARRTKGGPPFAYEMTGTARLHDAHGEGESVFSLEGSLALALERTGALWTGAVTELRLRAKGTPSFTVGLLPEAVGACPVLFEVGPDATRGWLSAALPIAFHGADVEIAVWLPARADGEDLARLTIEIDGRLGDHYVGNPYAIVGRITLGPADAQDKVVRVSGPPTTRVWLYGAAATSDEGDSFLELADWELGPKDQVLVGHGTTDDDGRLALELDGDRAKLRVLQAIFAMPDGPRCTEAVERP